MIRTALLLLPVLALGACASEIGHYGGDMAMANENFGYAVRKNIAVQTVNPTPSTQPVVASGERTAAAVAAYQSDTVENPGTATTMAMKANAGSESKQ
jgi:type IV pilus biogenesis protein CpaD/CtpE